MRYFFLIAILLIYGSFADAQTRRAFIVGVGEYDELTDLRKTVGDANGYTGLFNELNFEVTNLIDPDLNTFLAEFGSFVSKIESGDEVVFVFSGHGWSDGNENFLALKDAPQEVSEFVLKRNTISLPTDVMNEISSRKPKFTFAIIDACRDNPFDTGTKSVTKGLVSQPIIPGTLIVYAAGSRQKALDRLSSDDASEYSVFTRALLPKLQNPETPIMRSVDEARRETASLAASIRHEQRPAVYSDLSLDYCFAADCDNFNTVDARQFLRITAPSRDAEDPCPKYRAFLEDHRLSAYRDRVEVLLGTPPCVPEPAPWMGLRLFSSLSYRAQNCWIWFLNKNHPTF